MIVNRDLSNLSVSKNLQGNAQDNHMLLKRSYINKSDSFQSNKASSKETSFGALYKRPLLQRILIGDSFPELKRKWAVDAAFDLAKTTEKSLPKLKKAVDETAGKAVMGCIYAGIKNSECIKIQKALPSTIKTAKEKAIKLGLKPKKVSEESGIAKPLVLTKKEKAIIAKAVAEKFGLSGDKAKVKAISVIMDAKIAEGEMKKAERNLPKFKEKAQKLEDEVNLERKNDEIAEKKANEKRAKKRAKNIRKLKKSLIKTYKSLKKIIKSDFTRFTNHLKITSNKPKNKDVAKAAKESKAK